MFGNLFGHEDKRGAPELLPAIERAVAAVEPMLRQASGYPDNYRKPVFAALEYAHHLAGSVPGPVAVDRESYAKDAFVHALFPDADFVTEAICSSLALQDYLRDFPGSDEVYALMGMRRFEKSVVGMELSGEVVQHDVAQKAVFFTSHTIDNPAPSEQRARELVAMSFFDSLVGKVKQRVDQRKQGKQSQLLEKDMLMARLRTANALERPALEAELAGMMERLQAAVGSLDLRNYAADFEAVLLHPEEYLRLDQTPIMMDSMGIRRAEDAAGSGKAIMFNDLIGYDRRDWTVTMVRCSHLQNESFAEKLDKAYRRLAI
ncbi:MAG: hypothetical protein HY938_02855 [Nitrosomonadales bacterium]|nr:hypothetical protein [Nitrosomonadales bacterium]